MNDQEKLRRDIDTLKESIRLFWLDMPTKTMTTEDRSQLLKHISALVTELSKLLRRLDQSESSMRA